MFANCQLMGMDLAFPDICKTPPALIPIPYPNFALGPMGIPNAWNILLMGMPAHNLLTTIPLSNGDNAGLALGLISPSVMGPSRHITCVPNVLFKCIPATRLTSLAVQNRCNTVGARVIPSQLKVVLLGAGSGKGGAVGKKGAGGVQGASSSAKAANGGKSARAGHAAKRAQPKSASPRKTSLREKYLGRTPGKKSATGKKVQENMRKEGRLRDDPITGETTFKASNNKWYPLREADMSHKPMDAVKWWNQKGHKLGAKSPKVREWMLNHKNYELDHFSINRSEGAKLIERYISPLK